MGSTFFDLGFFPKQRTFKGPLYCFLRSGMRAPGFQNGCPEKALEEKADPILGDEIGKMNRVEKVDPKTEKSRPQVKNSRPHTWFLKGK